MANRSENAGLIAGVDCTESLRRPHHRGLSGTQEGVDLALLSQRGGQGGPALVAQRLTLQLVLGQSGILGFDCTRETQI
jgi:hypothetical protein